MRQDLTNSSLEEVVEMTYDKHTIDACNAICELVKRRIVSPEVKKALMDQANNEGVFWNYITVSDFSNAAMDILGIKKYEQDNAEVKRLIESNLDF